MKKILSERERDVKCQTHRKMFECRMNCVRVRTWWSHIYLGITTVNSFNTKTLITCHNKRSTNHFKWIVFIAKPNFIGNGDIKSFLYYVN